jgi:tetratricopeptide (TPR) repeat protein
MEQSGGVGAEPLVDAIHDPDSELRRGAIAALGKHGDRNAVRLIRSMLKDPNPDVRSDASVALARLESTFGRAISEAEALSRLDQAAAKDYADLCYQYATSDLLDVTSNHLYLVKAKIALRECLAYRPDNVDAWVLMARIHSALAEMAEAMTAVQRALALDTQTQEISLLGAEIAFRQQDWATLRALAIRACTTLQRQDERYEIMRWWARIPPKPRRDYSLSEPAFHPSTSPWDEAGNATLLARVDSGKDTM